MEGNVILVTGACGFIGSNLCEKLLRAGNEVIGIDNFFTGRKSNVETLLSNSKFRLIEHDIVDPIDIRVDKIYNLACPASPIHYQIDPIKTSKTNILGILNMLELAKSYNAKLLQASTSEVYGDPIVHPQEESYWGNVNPIGVRSCYDEGKRMAETLMMDYNREYDLKIKIVRIFNTYGPKMSEDDGRVVSNFILQALRNEPITIYGDGSQTRSFCYIDDLTDGLVKMMGTSDNFTGPINLGNDRENTILEFANIIRSRIKTDSGIEFRDLPKDDPKQRRPEISMAKKYLEWEPKVGLEEGLNRTIDYFKTQIEANI